MPSHLTFITLCTFILLSAILSTYAFNIQPCITRETKISQALANTNSFGPERKNALKKMKTALIMTGFEEKQVARYEGLRSMALEQQATDTEKSESIEKLCQAMLEDHVRNCVTELKALFKRKTPFEIKIAMQKVLKKRKFSDAKAELIQLAQDKEFDQICDQFADFWYHAKSNVYRSDEDDDEEDPYYPYPKLPLSRSQLSKLTNAQLRQIMTDRGQTCKGCRGKKEYVTFAQQIQSMAPMKNLEKIAMQGDMEAPQDVDGNGEPAGDKDEL